LKALDLYYFVKPAIPQNLRLALRRNIALRKRSRCADIWPINPATATRPKWWPGWPEGKQFAFVLTHDVEGRKGRDQSKRVAELEMEQGFRSSFNFIPEGEYDTPAWLRDFLVKNGFEVGVHDLHHDGTLYRSRGAFSRAAQRINQHLERWRAVGFRSGFMFHNLEWLKDLNVQYDASTFDTDPFEPQPDAANTIFPFWVPKSNGGGYVELPYSLPQDSTLYLVLGEKSNDIWKKKLDWVAEQGGMALLNVHPDYVAFDGAPSRSEFPAAFYRDLLAYVSSRYGSSVWHVLPKQVAQFVTRAFMPNTRAAENTSELLRGAS
jgi:hypothetical protein